MCIGVYISFIHKISANIKFDEWFHCIAIQFKNLSNNWLFYSTIKLTEELLPDGLSYKLQSFLEWCRQHFAFCKKLLKARFNVVLRNRDWTGDDVRQIIAFSAGHTFYMQPRTSNRYQCLTFQREERLMHWKDELQPQSLPQFFKAPLCFHNSVKGLRQIRVIYIGWKLVFWVSFSSA